MTHSLLDGAAVAELVALQDGVVSRRQLLEHGMADHDVARLLRRRELARVHRGVFVDHTGAPTWQQRAWAAVLHYWPAALCDDSAARALAGPGWRRHDDRQRISVAVGVHRNVHSVPGCTVRRVSHFDESVQWNKCPPRLHFDEVALDLAARAGSDLDAVGVLADAVQSRRTTAVRLLDRLEGRVRIRRRDWIHDVLRDVADGTCSVLEHGYLTRVERAHGLPRGTRQDPGILDGRPMFRDVRYDDLEFYVELDGRLFHDNARQRDRDLDRDLVGAVDGRHTVRLGWGQVFERGCLTASRLGVVMQRAGWTGRPTACGSDCAVIVAA